MSQWQISKMLLQSQLEQRDAAFFREDGLSALGSRHLCVLGTSMRHASSLRWVSTSDRAASCWGGKGLAAYVPHARLLLVLVVFLQVPSSLKLTGRDADMTTWHPGVDVGSNCNSRASSWSHGALVVAKKWLMPEKEGSTQHPHDIFLTRCEQ